MTWGYIGAAAITVVGSALSKKHGASSGAYDPYAPYRAGAAKQLQQLMANPDYLQQLPEYKADLMAASRTSASQGYNGSGNALTAAASAGGQAYQQAFSNLALLSGAGQSPANAAAMANQQANYQQQQNNQMWGQLGGIAGNLINNYTQNTNQNNPDYTPDIENTDSGLGYTYNGLNLPNDAGSSFSFGGGS
jgi:hypothetical protein